METYYCVGSVVNSGLRARELANSEPVVSFVSLFLVVHVLSNNNNKRKKETLVEGIPPNRQRTTDRLSYIFFFFFFTFGVSLR